MDIMLDLESMSLSSNAAIIAIGAVAFDKNKVRDKFYTEVNLQSNIDLGADVSGSTMMWWMQQSEEARKAFENNDNAPYLSAALLKFNQWYADVDGRDVWGNGIAADNVWIENAYKRTCLVKPWKHYEDKCYKTLKAFYPNIEFKRIGTYHNAVDDAESQALHLIRILKEMNHGYTL